MAIFMNIILDLALWLHRHFNDWEGKLYDAPLADSLEANGITNGCWAK